MLGIVRARLYGSFAAVTHACAGMTRGIGAGSHILLLRLALTVLGALFLVTAAHAEPAVTLHASGEINRATIRLSDLFDGVPEGRDHEIAAAPAPGKSVSYDARTLGKWAAQYRLGWQPQGFEDRVIVTRAATRITADMIRAAALAQLQEKGVKGEIEVQLDNRGLEVVLPADRAPNFTLNNFDYSPQSRSFRADLAAEGETRPVPVLGRVTVTREVPVLARRLEGGVQIGEADIKWVPMTDDRLKGDILTEIDQIKGRELRHSVAEGRLLNARDLIPPRLVTRGSLVTLKIETPAMLITAQGRALQDGGLGDTIRVTNTQSNRVVEGTVEATGLVRVGIK